MDSDAVREEFFCGRWRCCEGEAIVEISLDAVDEIQQDGSAGWNLQWEVVVCVRGLEIDDDASFWAWHMRFIWLSRSDPHAV